ncbi:hypothetical protein ACLOJK_015250 [Asimina triloba]
MASIQYDLPAEISIAPYLNCHLSLNSQASACAVQAGANAQEPWCAVKLEAGASDGGIETLA